MRSVLTFGRIGLDIEAKTKTIHRHHDYDAD